MATGSTASLLVLLTALTVTLLLAGYISSASHHQVQNAHIVGSFTDTRKLLRQLTVSVNKTRGLEARDHWFWINGKKTRLFSGAMHYFRIPREYWKDRLIKLRSSGCNVLETYVPWNLHEPHRGEYNFKDMLDLRAYVKLAEECGLFVILRPGPYICSEWDLGGLPSWLLSDSEMKLRSTYQPFIKSVESYFQELLPHVTDLQYSNGGGPIIAWQIENEYGSFGDDTDYLLRIQKLMLEYGCTELMFTSDNKQGIDNGGIDGVLRTANFKKLSSGKMILSLLEKWQPSMPRMCMEFWTGWFDHWGDKHQTESINKYNENLKFVLQNYGNINFYMFHGGTNFAFMNGANELVNRINTQHPPTYLADVTSYDYDALLTERGDTTPKYHLTVELLSKYKSEVVYLGDCPTRIVTLPAPHQYDDVMLNTGLSMDGVLRSAVSVDIKGNAVTMEMLPVNNGNGQSYGWILYRKTIEKGGKVKVKGQVRDRTLVFLDKKLVTTFDCNTPDFQFELGSAGVLDFLVENMGRTNYQTIGQNIIHNQRKGLNNTVTIDDVALSDWSVYSLDFTEDHLNRIKKEKFSRIKKIKASPAIFKGYLKVTSSSSLADTFLDMRGWGKGIVILNGRNLGRYWPVKGPTKTLYVPGVWLSQGDNEFMVFEIEEIPSDRTLKFRKTPVLG